jgi:hypothetical protein
MATTQPPTVDPSWPMGPDVLDLFATIRAEVAKTIALLSEPSGTE